MYDNPYPEGSVDHLEWADGYSDAYYGNHRRVYRGEAYDSGYNRGIFDLEMSR